MIERQKSFRVDIIGAGIAGLCLGIRLQRDGIQTTIYEQSATPGGLCTGWRRSGYDFNGCLHWILGSAKGSSFHDMWLSVADIDTLSFKYFDERADIEIPSTDGSRPWHFHLYNDVDKFEAYLLSIAPEDRDVISQWTGDIRMAASFLPDLPPFPTEKTRLARALHYVRLWRMWRLLPMMSRWRRHTNKTFARKFRNVRLAQAVARLYMNETPMTAIVFGQAYMTARVAGTPIGGSLPLTRLLTDTYTALGGSLRLSTPVKSVRIEDGRAVGLTLADGTLTCADAVCSCADWRWTVGTALKGVRIPAAMRALLASPKEAIFFSYCRVHIGYAAPLESLPHFLRLACPLQLPDGTSFEQLELEISNFDDTIAPQGKTTLTANFTTREGQWWIDLRRSDPQAYRRAKEAVLQMTMDALALHLPRVHGVSFSPSLVEVADVVTPATFLRFTGNSLGSSQGWSPLRDLLHRSPVRPTIPGLECFVMAGHWLKAGGGAPVALVSALFAEKIITELAKRLSS